MPPEFLQEGKYNTSGDVWQLGLIFYAVITLQYPFSGTDASGVLNSIYNTNCDTFLRDIMINYLGFRALIAQMLNIDLQQRITFQTIYEMLD